jgi:hypothetical protein
MTIRRIGEAVFVASFMFIAVSSLMTLAGHPAGKY